MNIFRRMYQSFCLNKELKKVEIQYGIHRNISLKLAYIVKYTKISLLDSNMLFNKEGTKGTLVCRFSNLVTYVELHSNHETMHGDRIYIEDPIMFSKNVKKQTFEDSQDLFGAGHDLSLLTIPDNTAEALADILVAWGVEFYNFYCYSSETHVTIMWGLYDYEFIFVDCPINDPSAISMYIETTDISTALNYINNNYEYSRN